MAEYIDRKALGIGKCNPDIFEDKGYANGWNSAIEIIEEAPTVDVEPVKHGKWYWEYDVVLDEYDYHCCSCGKNFAVKEKLTQLPNYCPNCGT